MIRKLLFIVLFLCYASVLWAQNHYTISGTVSDQQSNEKLIFASVLDTLSFSGCATNQAGFYSITLPEGKVVLQCSFIGYESKYVEIFLHSDTILNITLEQGNRLEEVVITAQNQNIIAQKNEVIKVPMKAFEKLPVMGGEPDILKSIQLLPGISPGSEGNTGFSVRGGSIDQNEILFDGVPVYNPNHVFGFFSVFNNDIINDIHFYKDYLPPKYGGRLSSVIDIYSKDGNPREYHGALSIGLLSSKLALEGPVFKNRSADKAGKTSFIFSARRSYIDLLAKPLVKNFTDFEDASYYFYDINAKIRHQFSEKNNLQLSIYKGKDSGESTEKQDYSFYQSGIQRQNFTDWGNLLSTLQWQYMLSKKIFVNYTLNYSKYNFSQSTRDVQYINAYTNDYLLENQSKVRALSNKFLVNYVPNTRNNIEAGLEYNHYKFKPGIDIHHITNEEEGINIDTTYNISEMKNTEYVFHVSNEFLMHKHVKLKAGGRLTYYASDNKNYVYFDPRISLNYTPDNHFGFSASYNRTHQYIHLLSKSQISQANDLWLPCSKELKPQSANQYSLSIEYTPNSRYYFSLSPYYKTMQNLVEYSDGASFLQTFNGWDEITEQGKGTAYGIDFFAEKKTGKTTGWIAYTYSHSERKFENINYGESFLYRYDRPHVLKIVANQKLSDTWSLGLSWHFMSGSMATIATQKDWYELIYERNAYRLPTYHRLDVSVQKTKQRKWGKTELSIGVYNTYNRSNIYNVNMEEIPNSRSIHGTAIYYINEESMFPVMPSINYKIEF